MKMYFYMLGLFFMMISLSLISILYLTIIEEKIYILNLIIYNLDMMDMKLYFYMDYMSNLFLLIISLITMSVYFYSYYYMMGDKMNNKFLILIFLFVSSMFIMVISMNFYMILIGWDGLGIVSYFLIIHYMSNNSDYSGMVTILTNRLGDIGMIFSLFLLMNFKTLDVVFINMLNNFNYLLMLMLSLGVMTKSAQFPFSVWLPLAMAAPTPISSLVHSSTLVTAGLYLYIRMTNLFLMNCYKNLLFIMIFYLFTSILASISALSEVDIKKIIAFSTLSQLSLMLMILFLGEEMMTFFHILTHAMFKALLFLCSGAMIHEYFNNQDMRKFPSISKTNLFILSMFYICCLSLMGFPFMSGFYSKDLILEKMYSLNINMFLMLLMMISTLLTSVYSFRLMWFSTLKGKSNYKMYFNMKWSNMYYSLIMMIIMVIFIGSMLNWMLLDKFTLIYISIKIKMINYMYMLIGLMMFNKMNISVLNKNINFMMNMFYMTTIQGKMFNTMNKNIIFYSTHSEYMLENMFSLKIKKFNQMMNMNINMYKYLSIFISLMFLLYIMMFMMFS